MAMVAALLALWPASSLHASSLAPGPRVAVCVARDTGQTPAAMLRADARYDCSTPQATFGPGDYWLRVDRLPAGAGTTLTRLLSPWQLQARSQLFVAFGDGAVIAMPVETPRTRPASDAAAVGEIALPRPGARATALLWRIGGSANIRRILAETHFATPEQAAREEARTLATFATFIGVGLSLLAYNFALWIALRRRFQLAYCGVAASLLAYATILSGILTPIVPGIDRNAWIAAAYGSLTLSFAAALWFVRSFLGRHLPARIGRGFGVLGVLLLVATAAMFVTPLRHLRLADQAQGTLSALAVVMTVPLLALAWRKNPAFFVLVALTWAGSAVLAAMRLANAFHLTPVVFVVRDRTLIMLAAQAIAGSLAVAWRINRLARERDEARAQELAARLLADADPLTGILNRRAFLARAVGREGAQLLMLADLDHFKAINETIGHDGGDEVLRGFARALTDALPPGALVARIGGEEFAVVVDAAALVSPGIVTEALRRVRTPFDLRVTASVGTCTGALATEADWKTLYRLADQALFAAKAAGRDRIRDAAGLVGVGPNGAGMHGAGPGRTEPGGSGLTLAA